MWYDSEEEEERDEVYIGVDKEEEIGERHERRSLMDTIFSWSIEEIVNRDLYRGEVSVISLLHWAISYFFYMNALNVELLLIYALFKWTRDSNYFNQVFFNWGFIVQ